MWTMASEAGRCDIFGTHTVAVLATVMSSDPGRVFTGFKKKKKKKRVGNCVMSVATVRLG